MNQKNGIQIEIEVYGVKKNKHGSVDNHFQKIQLNKTKVYSEKQFAINKKMKRKM